jgi:hypothetical protein
MRKKRLSSVDLSWMIFERMREEIGEPRVSVAVVSDSKLGWRAVLQHSRRSLSPSDVRKFRAIENELRSKYALASDEIVNTREAQ